MGHCEGEGKRQWVVLQVAVLAEWRWQLTCWSGYRLQLPQLTFNRTEVSARRQVTCKFVSALHSWQWHSWERPLRLPCCDSWQWLMGEVFMAALLWLHNKCATESCDYLINPVIFCYIKIMYSINYMLLPQTQKYFSDQWEVCHGRCQPKTSLVEISRQVLDGHLSWLPLTWRPDLTYRESDHHTH